MTTDDRAVPDRPAPSLWQIFRAYLVLPHATPILVVLTTTASIAIVANDGFPSTRTFLNLLLAMLGGQIAIGAVNEVIDAPTDALVKPSKPIPAGLVTTRGATLLSLISVAGMVLFAARLGWESLVLCAFGTATGIAYSVWFKRTVFAWFPYLVALPLLPIWVFTAVNRFDARLLMLYPLGVFAVIGVYLSQSLPDIAADRASGVDNLTSRLGEGRSFAICIGTQILSALLSVAAAARWSDLQPIIFAAVIATTLCAVNVGLYRWRPQVGVRACFPCIALATAILGIGWVTSIS